MVNITLSVPEELKAEMEKFPEINWSVIVRTALKRRVLLLQQLNEFTKDSEFTKEDALRLGKEVNRSFNNKLKKLKEK